MNKFLKNVFDDTEEYYLENIEKFNSDTSKQIIDDIKVNNIEFSTMNISVENTDCVLVTKQLSKSGKTCLLNMASITRPGGGVRNGAMAQEEEVCRRSNLVFELETMSYPLLNNEYIYSKNIKFFRDGNNYPFIKPFIADVITIAAVNLNKGKPSNYDLLMRNKIRGIFQSCYNNNCTNLVLSAFGCGVFKNDPRYVASLFKEELEIFDKCFNNVTFAILNDRNSVGSNYEIFKEILENS